MADRPVLIGRETHDPRLSEHVDPDRDRELPAIFLVGVSYGGDVGLSVLHTSDPLSSGALAAQCFPSKLDPDLAAFRDLHVRFYSATRWTVRRVRPVQTPRSVGQRPPFRSGSRSRSRSTWPC